MEKEIYITNLAGEKELFSTNKIYQVLKRLKISESLINEIIKKIEKEIYPGISTKEIFEKIKSLLIKREPQAGLRYSLKEALRKLGPSGFPFEKYVGSILSKNGYEVHLNQIIPGFCIENYEIDFIAKKGEIIYVGECKYHSLPGNYCDLKVALANYARFSDIMKGDYFKKEEFKNLKIKSILVTNTKFTSQALKYSNCTGVELIGWRYPENKGFEYLIESQKLYPITILPSFKESLFKIFISLNLMLVSDLLKIEPKKFAKENNIPLNKILTLIEEAKILLS
jgi:hypothetical protein